MSQKFNPFKSLIEQAQCHALERPAHPNARGIDPHEKQAAILRLARGESPTAVAKDIGVSRTSVMAWKRNANLRPCRIE